MFHDVFPKELLHIDQVYKILPLLYIVFTLSLIYNYNSSSFKDQMIISVIRVYYMI